jgi:hypothetical protein
MLRRFGLSAALLFGALNMDQAVRLYHLYARTGEALSAWGRIEDALCTIFMTGIASRNYNASHAAFFAIVSFDAKLSVADCAIRAALETQPAHLQHWVKLKNTLQKKKSIRNKLAHSQAVYNAARDEARLLPYYSVVGPVLPDWNGGWTVSNIEEYIIMFNEVNDMQIAFLKKLREDLDMWPTDWRPARPTE